MQGKAVFAAKAQPHRRAEVEDMLQAIEDQKQGRAMILDARSTGQYTGEVCCISFCVVHAVQCIAACSISSLESTCDDILLLGVLC